MYSSNKNKKKFAEWLEVLQQESWQLELLISGFAIFGLYSARPHINEITQYIMVHGNANIAPIFLLALTLPLAWLIFTSNLIIHVFIRGLWIGAIGLRYVSGDIDYQSLRFNEVFIDYYKRKIGSFDNYIERLEKISSVIFSVTFLMFFMLLSFLMFLAILAGIALLAGHLFGTINATNAGFNMTFNNNPIAGIILGIVILSFLFLGIFVLIDFITFGFFRKRKSRRFSKFFLAIYRFFSFITLSFLWRPLFLNFLDERFTKKTLMLAFPYAFALTLLFPNMKLISNPFVPKFDNRVNQGGTTTNGSFYYNHYDDERDKRIGEHENLRIEYVSIPSMKVRGSTFAFFVKAHSNDENALYEIDSIYPIYNKGLHNSIFTTIENQDTIIPAAKNLNNIRSTIQESFSVRINEYEIIKEKVQCRFYAHPNQKENGLLCFFPIDSLSKGIHDFHIKKNKTFNITIPFIYEKY